MQSLGRVLVAAATLTLMAAPAYAQHIRTGATGTFGQVQLTSGFTPDPHMTTLNAGGPIDASTLSDSCTGFIAERPSFTLRYRHGDLPLYVAALSDEDTTLVVRGPDGQWVCNDDGGENLNPLVSWEHPRDGRYQIWVGRFGVADLAPAQLYISEVGGPANHASADAPDYSLDPAYGTIELVSGFQPDPHSMSILAGGGYDASQISGCVGWVATAPDYRVNFTAGSAGLPLIFSVQSDADTTLVINDAQGNWVCNDDTDGLNPVVRFDTPASGQYDVWLGTFAEGSLEPSTLNVSELTPQ